MLPAEFEPAIPTSEPTLSHALERATTYTFIYMTEFRFSYQRISIGYFLRQI